jgi:hypothetical protein
MRSGRRGNLTCCPLSTVYSLLAYACLSSPRGMPCLMSGREDQVTIRCFVQSSGEASGLVRLH